MLSPPGLGLGKLLQGDLKASPVVGYPGTYLQGNGLDVQSQIEMIEAVAIVPTRKTNPLVTPGRKADGKIVSQAPCHAPIAALSISGALNAPDQASGIPQIDLGRGSAEFQNQGCVGGVRPMIHDLGCQGSR
jgi:hypothetical protein